VLVLVLVIVLDLLILADENGRGRLGQGARMRIAGRGYKAGRFTYSASEWRSGEVSASGGGDGLHCRRK
jgi:hypothetical protein